MRTVGTRLTMDVADYVRGAQRAEKATSDLKLDVRELGIESRAAAGLLGKAERSVDELGDTARLSARALDAAADGVTELGAEARVAALGVDKLNDEIAQTQRRLLALAAEIRTVGPDAGLLGAFRDEQAQLARLRRVRHALAELADTAQDASRFTLSGLTSTLEALPQQLKGAAIVGGLGLATVVGPMIGAAITGAIVGAVSGGAIAAGIASAARDERVRAAWGLLAADAQRVFDDFGAPFVQPTVDAIGVLRGTLGDVRGDISEIARVASRFVRPLVEGVGGFVREVTPGLRELVREAEPVFDMLRDELPVLGHVVGEFFADMGDSAEGGAESLRAFFRVVDLGLAGLGEQLKIYAGAIEGAAILNERFGGPLDFLFGPMRQSQISQFGETGETALRKVRDGAEKAGEAAETAAERFERLFGGWMDLDETAIRVEEALDDITESIKENGRTLDIHTQKGRDNRQALLDAVQAAEDHRQAMIDNGISVAHANDVYATTIQRLYDQATAAGVSRSELDKLLGKYRDLANAPDITKNVKIRFVTEGKAPPAARPGQILAFAHGGIHDPLGQTTGLVAAQHGLITDRPMVLFGERGTGMEAFIPRDGISRERGLGLLDVAARWHGAAVVPWEQMATKVSLAGMVIENRIEVGGEVVRVVRSEIRDHDRRLVQRARAGAGRR